MTLRKAACCKVNLLLNVLGKRADGFHELETVLHPVALFDHLTFHRNGQPFKLTCNQTNLPADSTNLVWRAAQAFFQASGLREEVHIHLEKNIPLAAGLGGGSSNAAATLEGLNELFDQILAPLVLRQIAGHLGSDVPFFLQPCPALATGRGDHVISLEPFPALAGASFVLVYPGFGISTAWAYQQLSWEQPEVPSVRQFPEAMQARPSRARFLITQLQTADLNGAASAFYNSLEVPALKKYPLLEIIREFLRDQGAPVSLMSGSGSTVFGILPDSSSAERVKQGVLDRFGEVWCEVVEV